MKKKLRIVFMGTPDFAVQSLKLLIKKQYNVVAVVTVADKPAGRGQKLKESSVKQYAKSQNLTLLQPTNLKNNDFITALKALNANLYIIVAFRMLPKVVWEIPKYGTFNLHASLLPNYRGAAPINWVIINGEKKTGVTTFFIDEQIDTGEIILQKKTKIKANETAGELHDKLMHLGSKLVIKTVNHIEQGKVKTKPQPITKTLKTAYKLNKENCRINWFKSIKKIKNKVRGLNPYPTSWAILKNNNKQVRLQIYDVDIKKVKHNYPPGHIVSNTREIKVANKKGFIILKDIKMEGKRKMDVKTLLNGYRIYSHAKML